jgi:GIY-YIG catalytic domain
MDSGIYRLTYQTGETYVGKSIHLATRWKQHFDKLKKGTAAKNMQDAFYASGCRFPRTEVLLYCHPDLLDYYEGFFINDLKPALNTAIPDELPDHSKQVLIKHANLGFAGYSVVTMIEVANNFSEKVLELEQQQAHHQEQFEELEADYHELSEAWADRAIRDCWATREYRAVVGERDYHKSVQGSLEREVHELRLWRLRVEGANWWQRLWKSW